jgi:hypothetical protein
MSPKRTAQGSYDSLLTEFEYATGKSMPSCEISSAHVEVTGIGPIADPDTLADFRQPFDVLPVNTAN